jgi:transcriptional regulator with XRE-family HTH domain
MNITEMSDRAAMALIGERIQKERLNQNLTQYELAVRAGIGARTVRSLEAGQKPTVETLILALRALGRLATLDAFLPEPDGVQLRRNAAWSPHWEERSPPRTGWISPTSDRISSDARGRRDRLSGEEDSVNESGRRERITIRLRPLGYGATGWRESQSSTVVVAVVVNRNGRKKG